MIIGLTGRAGSGKDWTFDYLRDDLELLVVRRAFADQLRYEIQDVLAEGAHMPALWQKPYPDEIRRLLQWWGTDLRRHGNPNYWIEAMQAQLQTYRDSPDLAVVTDVRFPNEAAAIRELGGSVVRVWAPERVRKERLGGILPPDHPSETALDHTPADITLISNYGVLTPADDQSRLRWAALLSQVARWEGAQP